MKWEDIHTYSERKASLLSEQVSEENNSSPDEGDEMAQKKKWLAEEIETYQRFNYLVAFRKLQKRQLRRRIIRISAVACITVCLLTTALYLFFTYPSTSVPMAHIAPLDTNPIYPGERKVFLTTTSGDIILLGKENKQWQEKNGTSIVVDTSGIKYTNSKTSITDSIQYNSLTVPRGGEYSITLSDGTRIWLNADSHLKYPLKFTETQRTVYLTGEAYMEVKHNEKWPFVVITNLGNVRVLGTSFNVKQYAEEDFIEATLVEGSISFDRPGMEAENIRPGYQLTYQKDAVKAKVYPVKVQNYISWKDDVFCFDNKTLEEIMIILSRWYNVKVDFERESLKKLTFSGNLSRYADIVSFFRVFEAGANVQFEIMGREIKVK